MHTRTALLVIDAQPAFDQWVLAGFRAFAAPVLHVRHRSTLAGSAFLPDARRWRGSRSAPMNQSW